MTRIIKYTAVLVASALASEAFTGKLRQVMEDAIIRQLHMTYVHVYRLCCPLFHLPKSTHVTTHQYI